MSRIRLLAVIGSSDMQIGFALFYLPATTACCMPRAGSRGTTDRMQRRDAGITYFYFYRWFITVYDGQSAQATSHRRDS